MEDYNWDKLKSLLEDRDWPDTYVFKFVVPNEESSVTALSQLFNHETSKISFKSSKKGNYVSMTAIELMMSADAVLEKYKKAGGIKGLIAL